MDCHCPKVHAPAVFGLFVWASARARAACGMYRRSMLFLRIGQVKTGSTAIRPSYSLAARLLSGGPGGFRTEPIRWTTRAIGQVSIRFRLQLIGHQPMKFRTPRPGQSRSGK